MTDEPRAARPARRPLPRIPLAAAVGVALVVGVVGYAAGQGRGGGSQGSTVTSSACSAATQAATSEAKAASDSRAGTGQMTPQGEQDLRTGMHVIIQNPGCFNPQLVGQAQTTLDALDQQNAQDAARFLADCATSKIPLLC